MESYKVYVQVDDNKRIVAVNSNSFLDSTDGWIYIDQGYGDKYFHAQGNYLDKFIVDDRGIYQYKLVDGIPVERTQEEMDADYTPPIDVRDLEIQELKQQLAALSAAMLNL